ncbi:MAG: hypothetical protein SGJ07_12950 [Rhodospirillaceae bacterium]|nr:hypothetical protein [Rhodospirillaceae bacterium]
MTGSGFPFATRTGLAAGFAATGATGFAAAGAGFTATSFATGAFTAPVFATCVFTTAGFAAGVFVGAALAVGFAGAAFAGRALAAGFAFAAGFAEFLLTAFAGFAVFLLVAVFVTFDAFFFVVTGFGFEAALSRRRMSAVLAAGCVLPPVRLPDGADLAAAGRPVVLVFFFAFLSAPFPDAVLLVAMDRLWCPFGRSPPKITPPNHAPASAIREPFAAAANGQRPRFRRFAGLQAGSGPDLWIKCIRKTVDLQSAGWATSRRRTRPCAGFCM